MKRFTTEDSFMMQGKRVHIVLRAHSPKTPIQKDEMPQPGEPVLLDAKEQIVAKCDLLGDSEFHWYPRFAIHIEQT